ncbi:MAG TPA: L,D-transpeptidase [Segeticoccus sp.]|uniref:L,D-transpeptidase n=1 Tax=Segeticoccus sp. TaxID=2706531 RepID=UPI002D7E7972|nr:L,D-transpeptidase [Segeticoccus sp.]HET8600456.1 L,D-transpeptidase [Segeticoccus sp.]
MSGRGEASRGARAVVGRLGASGLGVLTGFLLTGLALAACGAVAGQGHAHVHDASRRVAAAAAPSRIGSVTSSASPRAAEPAAAAAPTVVPPVRVSPQQRARLIPATTFADLPNAPVDLTRPSGGKVVHIGRSAVGFVSPGGPALATIPARQIGMPTWLPVIAQRPGWVQVRLPSRPNGATAWLPSTGLQRARTSWAVRIDLAREQLTIHRGGRLEGRWPIGEGAPATPTPAGQTFLLASFVDRAQSYSPVIFATGAHSDTLDSYGGGPGTVAVHGWPTTDGRSGRVSHGCVRVPSDALAAFRLLPLGTPISIVA